MKQRTLSKIIAFALAISILITLCFCFIPTVTADTNISDIGYNDSTDTIIEDGFYNYSFSYATKSVKEYYISGIPYYFNLNNTIENTCANVAGTEVLAYYSVYTDTLDGYVAGQIFDDFTWYYSYGSSPKIQETINELYKRMGTNSEISGTSEDEFEMGMNSYCSSRGLNIKYTDFVDSSKINFNSIKAVLEENKVFVAFMNNYNMVVTYIDNNNTVTCMRKDVKSNHMMMVYGYSETHFYDESGKLIKHLIALDVASGFDAIKTKVFLDHTANLVELKLIEISD